MQSRVNNLQNPADVSTLKELFSTQLPAIQEKLSAWWEFAEQKHPCLLITLPPDRGVGLPDTDDLNRWWMDTDFILHHQMKLIEGQQYFGQAIPFHYIDCSSSAMSGVLGARMQLVNKDTMWAYPCYERVEQVVDMALRRDTFWYRQARSLTEKSVAKAKDHHYVSLFAMEGITDILAGLYGTENFLADLVEKPNEVSQAAEKIKRIWIDLFQEFQGLLSHTGNRGGIGWAGIWAPGTHFPMQEDFSYMISNRMFKRFVFPHLMDMVDAIEYPLYHLDGVGALSHLETLLSITKLKAIQWVPGAGKESIVQWYPLIQRILSMRKSVQVFAEVAEVDDLVKNVGSRGLLITVRAESVDEAEKLVERYS